MKHITTVCLRLLSFSLALYILASLTACSSGTEQTQPPDESGTDSLMSTVSPSIQEQTTTIEPPEGVVLIRGGSFQMGSPDTEAWRSEDETSHPVTVGDFYMSAYEVTQSEYQATMGTNPSEFSGEDPPVENVSWLDAIAYCNARSEAEGLTPVYQVDGQSVS